MNNRLVITIGSIALIIGALIPLIGLYVQQAEPGRPRIIAPRIIVPRLNLQPGAGITGFPSYRSLYEYLRSHVLVTYMSAGLKIPATAAPGTIGPLLTMNAPLVQASYTGSRGEGYGGSGGSEYSSTNVQVKGIDEPDYVKTNGGVIAVAYNNRLVLVDPFNYRVSSIIILRYQITGLLIHDNYLAVIAVSRQPTYRVMVVGGIAVETHYPGEPVTHIKVYGVGDPYNPVELYSHNISGSYIGARLDNDTLYVITGTEASYGEESMVLPAIDGKPLPPETILVPGKNVVVKTYNTVTAIRLPDGAVSTVSILSEPGSMIYMNHGYIILASSHWYTLYYESTRKIMLRLLNSDLLDNETKTEAMITLAGYGLAAAESYVEKKLSEMMDNMSWEEAVSFKNRIAGIIGNHTFSANTTLYYFKARGLTMNYTGIVTIRGGIRDQFSLDMINPHYTIVSTTRDLTRPNILIVENPVPGSSPGKASATIRIYEDGAWRNYNISFAKYSGKGLEGRWRIYIGLKPVRVDNAMYIIENDRLSTVSVLDGIAPTESIRAARILGDLYILVTYRRIDPLFAINVSDPQHPRVIGWLKELGYNEYLHPLDNDHLLGIGRDQQGGLKIEIYDISSPDNIRPLSVLRVEESTSPVIGDYHAFLIDTVYERIIIPLTPWRIGAVVYSSIRTWNYAWTAGFIIIGYDGYRLHTEAVTSLPGGSRALYIDGKYYMVSPASILVLDRATLVNITSITLT